MRLTKSNRRKVLTDTELSRIVDQTVVTAKPSPDVAANAALPDSFDWRREGFVTAVNNQKSCGSCYAFSIAHCIQAQVFKRTGRIVPLSEQQIVDCSIKTGNHGCAGGSLRTTLKYVQKSGGLMREQDYPYVSAVSMRIYIYICGSCVGGSRACNQRLVFLFHV